MRARDRAGDGLEKMVMRVHQPRREQAAIEYARSVQAKASELEQRFQATDSARLGEAKSRVETQAVALKQIIKKAREEGDTDTEFEAQERLTQVLLDQRQISSAEQLRQQRVAQQAQQVQYQAPQPQYQQAPQVDPKAEQWAEDNEWFGRDIVMTNAARGIHLQLVTQESFDPQSEDYYQ